MAAADRSEGFTDRVDPNFVIGRVADAADDGTLTIVTPESELRTARISSGASYWKAGVWNEHEIATRDCVMGRGPIDADGAVVVDRVWANVMKLDGFVEAADSASGDVRLRGSDKRLYRMSITDETLAVDRHERRRDGDAGVVSAGDPATVIAYRDPKTGGLFAHRLESALADPDALATPEEPEAKAARRSHRSRPTAHAAIAVDRSGNASYFCCNTSGGCSCGSAPTGFCSGCHSASWQIAWPKVTGCTAPCVGCCLPADFPRYACHTDLYVRNACQTGLGWIQVAVKDCGPNPRCRTTGCMGWQGVKFDLTACAFSALGGSFSIGHMNMQASTPV